MAKEYFIHSFAKTFKDARPRHEDDEYADSYDCAEEPVLVGAGEGRRGVVAELDCLAVAVREANICEREDSSFTFQEFHKSHGICTGPRRPW